MARRYIEVLRDRDQHPHEHPNEPALGPKGELTFERHPPVNRVWFVCAPDGRPFPHSAAATRRDTIRLYLKALNLGGVLFRSGRTRWWQFFRRRGFNAQRFHVKPIRDDPSWAQYLHCQLRSERRWKIGTCVFCSGVARFNAIAQDLEKLIDAIDYYEKNPAEQVRWLDTMRWRL